MLRTASDNSLSTPNLQQIAQDIFTRMTEAAEALVKNDSPENFRRFEQEGNSLLTMDTLSQKNKRQVWAHLKLLSGIQATDGSLTDSQKAK